jgi:hypothetical protein
VIEDDIPADIGALSGALRPVLETLILSNPMSLRCFLLLLAPLIAACADSPYFRIRVVDRQTGRGVPLVALKTNNNIVCFTDSNGIVAWNEPGLMDRDVYFRIESPGYRFPSSGITLHVKTGGQIDIKIQRLNIAERLYRVTGQGIYRDSILTAYPVPIREPALNAQVLGQDTVRVTPYRGKLFWLWGDTDRASGPLGNFSTTSATSELPVRGGLDPSVGVDLHYFTGPDGFVKPMCNWPVKGLKWLHSLLTVRDPSGAERLVANYDSIGEHSRANESGLAVFNDERQEFDRLVVFPSPEPEVGPGGVPPLRVRSGGVEYFYFCNMRPGPVVRVRADWKSIQDLNAYSVFDGEWKSSAKLPPARNTWLDMETGQPIEGAARVSWSEYRKRWIGIVQKNPGEVWYAEADTPTGPWVYATRVASNGNYYFYWPVQHPFFDQDGGRKIYFEGTYTDTFSGNPVITPRYNYNQLMYRLSLDDPRLYLPAPVYRLKDGRYLMREGVEAAHAWDQVADVPFFALPRDRRRSGTIEIGGGLFYGLPVSAAAGSPGISGAWNCDGDLQIEFRADGERISVDAGGASGSGTLRGGVVEFVVQEDGAPVQGTAMLEGGKLVVTWKDARNGGGRFNCERVAAEDQWLNSKALVPLYASGGNYTTHSSAGARVVGRVWRTPAGQLLLDRDASPVRD